jgi:4,5-dihydroxyphthalate decarboxylase
VSVVGGTMVRIALACGDYDRTRALRDGRVHVQGVDLTYLALSPEETFFRMLHHGEFEAAEMSLSSYVLTLAHEEPRFVALPVFPSRAFRHSCIFTNTAAAIDDPADLRGRLIGVPEYQMTAAVWIRGILAEHHGLPVDAVRYRTGGLERPGRAEKLPLSLPPGVDVAPIPPGRTLSEMLVAGDIEALYTARPPSPFVQGAPEVRRLFADAEAVEREYVARTGIFPVMHVVVLRCDVAEAHPWLAGELTKAFEASRRLASEALRNSAALAHMDPWLVFGQERARALMGDDFWPYGLEPNRHVLETFVRYSHEQGLAARRFSVEELFAPQTLESYVI